MVDIHIAAEILKLGKKLAPDRFPKPDPEITQAWAYALNREYPTRLWAESVYLWATQRVEDKMGPDPRKVDTSGVSYAAWVSVADVSASKSSGARRLHQECRLRV
ncbi:hypothetical protein ACL1BY_06150, partial [Corynebacterium striatum]